MTVCMDGLRRTMAEDFNHLVRILKPELESVNELGRLELIGAIMDLRGDIGGLLACYDPREQPKDWNMLADDIDLENVEEDE